MLGNWIHHCRRAFSSLKRSLLINTITMFTVTIALLLLAGYVLLLNNVNRWIHENSEHFQIRVFLESNLSAKAVEQLRRKIAADNTITLLKHLNRDEARNLFLAKHPDFKSIINDLSDNPFPDTFIIKATDESPAKVQDIANRLSRLPGVEDVDYGEHWYERFVAIRGVLKLGSYILASLIILACVFLVSNTIRLNIFTRKDEIEIFKLVGGTRPFIAIPFVIEGVVIGILGAAAALFLLYCFFHLALGGMSKELDHLTGSLNFIFLSRASIFLVFIVGIGSGFFGSLFSLRRFLRY